MSTAIAVVCAALALAVAYLIVRAVAGVYWKYRGDHVVKCPENQRPAGVHVDLRNAAKAALHGSHDIRLDACSRWPEKQNCGQACLSQIERSPEDCMVRHILAKWYDGKTCICCGKAIGEIHWDTHKPGLLSPERHLVAWSDVPAENVPDVLSTHQPVCWNCMVVQSMISHHPELVLDRSRKI